MMGSFLHFSGRTLLLKSALFATILDFALTFTANAVCPRPIPAPNAEFFKTSMVIAGKVISEKPDVNPYDNKLSEGWFYRIRVERTFRGAQTRFVAVYTENDNARFPLKVGERYVLFVYHIDRRREINGCGNSALLSEAGAVINAIEAISRAGPYGEIEGRVKNRSEEAGIPGIRVIATQGQKSYSAITVQDGWFQMRVPPGTYRLSVQSPNLVIESQDSVYNYDNPDQFIVHRGSSAHFEFFAGPQ
jgi:Carboxypeptidase regulatory-like domain